jgi:hypothetical protein
MVPLVSKPIMMKKKDNMTIGMRPMPSIKKEDEI